MPFVALFVLVLIGSAGLAMDGARLMLMHTKLQTAIDAAGLSAVARLNSTDINGQVGKFARANFLSGYVDATIVSLSSQLSADEDTLTVTGTATAPTTFLNVFGLRTMQTTAQTKVTRAMGGLEVAMILDVTGSMTENNKIGSLRTAANVLLDILFGTDATVDKLHIGIVPFAQAVNIGTTRGTWLTKSGGSKWKGCVEERFNGRDTTDDPPSIEAFNPYTGACPAAVTPMTSTKATLVSAIASLKADGYTHVNVGAVWGWRMLSPRWQGLWGGSMGASMPLKYGASGMSKAAIIMTDGDNWMPIDGTATAYGEIDCPPTCYSDARLNVTGTSGNMKARAEAAMDVKLTAVCTKMKNIGITVYTVALGNPGKTIETLLKSCASQPAFYFDSPTGADLKTAFAKIGDSLSSLRVSR